MSTETRLKMLDRLPGGAFANKPEGRFGNNNKSIWGVVFKAWSEPEEWMKTTKVMDLGVGCVLQVTTQQHENVAESVCYIPNVKTITLEDGSKQIVALTLWERIRRMF